MRKFIYICDICGRELSDATAEVIYTNEKLDVCNKCYEKVNAITNKYLDKRRKLSIEEAKEIEALKYKN